MNNKKAAVYIILGQSNAVGHKLVMEEKDIIHTPLKNVFGLSRKNNQSFDNTELLWSGYTSFDMNLAEEQDDTYSVPNCLAALWQKHIDDGNKLDLPDLYIVQIAIGAQGVSKGCMWYYEREKRLIPGKLGQVDISLFPYTKHIFSLLDDSFKKQNKEYEIIGLHWRGGEGEVNKDMAYLSQNLENIYKIMLDDFNAILKNPPIVLHKIVCCYHMLDRDPIGNDLQKMHYINEVFSSLEKQYNNITVFDPATAPQYIPDVYGNGIFLSDACHFTAEVNNWVAEKVIEKYCER